ncbi:MAG TPA: hypothetical protein VF160_09055 [Candidatus Dormibacteraeota bacterium]
MQFVAACTPASAPFSPPAAGVLLLGLADGSQRGQLTQGDDPVAVEVSADGATAFVSDNRGGRVLALALPSLRTVWTSEVGGRPGPLLASLDALYVSLYDAGQVVELALADGAVLARHPAGRQPGQLALTPGGSVLVHGAEGVRDLEGGAHGGGAGFALGGGWSGDYDSGTLLDLETGTKLGSPPHLHPFWLTAGPGSTAYAAAEGDDEDRDAGAVLEVRSNGVRTLARAKDPDQVAYVSGRVFAAAHADHAVLVLDAAGRAAPQHWAVGSAPVALAADPRLGLLIVVVNAAE